MTLIFRLLAIAALSLVATAQAHAHDYKLGDLRIGHPWAKPSLKGVANGAAYMTITNTGAADDKLLAAQSDAADAVELHSMTMTDGVMRMRKIEGGIALPSGGTVALEPGGLHVMLIGLKHPLEIGDRVDLALSFAEAGETTVELVIEDAPTDDGAHRHHEH